jgi:hypothetical protein
VTTGGVSATERALTVIVAAGLAVDVYVHFHLASDFAQVKTSTLSQADIFRVDSVVAIIAAVLVLALPRRSTVLFAFLVAAAGIVAVVLYRYVDVGTIGPIPNMYDPYWEPAEKAISAIAELIAALAAAALYVRLSTTQRLSTAASARP